MWEKRIFTLTFDHLEFYETFSDLFSDENQLGLILFFKKMPLHVASNNNKEKTLGVFIPLDLEGHFKTNYSEQADFLEEFPVVFE